MNTRLVDTSLGPVEVALSPGAGEVIVFFPGGHTSAATSVGTDLYTDLGYRTLTFSRPGYGRTDVGPLTAAAFVPAVAEVCGHVRITSAAATVGLSFGGLQAVHVAVGLPQLAPRLILHSCGPSSLPYPDTAPERLGAPLAFGRGQKLTWRLLRAVTASDRGLRVMMSRLSTLPTKQWWSEWTTADRAAARAMFAGMDSGTGFGIDMRQATKAGSAERRALLSSVTCPTLVTASRHDRGVAFAHAQDFVSTVPGSRLVDTGARTHLAWLGASREPLSAAVRDFLGELETQA